VGNPNCSEFCPAAFIEEPVSFEEREDFIGKICGNGISKLRKTRDRAGKTYVTGY
jgi:hypothetical protein